MISLYDIMEELHELLSKQRETGKLTEQELERGVQLCERGLELLEEEDQRDLFKSGDLNSVPLGCAQQETQVYSVELVG